MGMYTQIRGWLNIESIGDYDGQNYYAAVVRLEKAKSDFEDSDLDVSRKWVCRDTHIHRGGNCTAFIFFGTELKNYDDDAYEWIKFLLSYFPSAEGRIDFQYETEKPWKNLDAEPSDKPNKHGHFYEEDEDGGYSRYLLIRNGEVIKDDTTRAWCNGYGNDFK